MTATVQTGEEADLHIEDPQLFSLYEYWLARRGSRAMPSRADIDPSDIPALLPYVYMIDVAYDPLSFRFRLAGTEIVELFGEEVTGKTTDELATLRLRDLLRGHYEQMLKDRRPAYETKTFAGHDRYLVYSRLLLPLSTDGQAIDVLLGATISLSTHRHAI